MSDHTTNDFDSDADRTPLRPGQMSSNGHWVFGSIYAGLALVGFAFGVWAGVPKSKPVEVAEAKPKEAEKAAAKPPAVTPSVATPPQPVPPVEPKPVEPKPMEPEPKPKPKEPEPKPKEPEPKPKPKEPEPKKPAKAVVFKEVLPILRTYCFDCHGAAGKPKGEVDVTTVAKMLKSKGPPLVAGKPDQSSLYLSIKSGDMPPDGKKGPDAKELQLLYDWIAGGAKERRRTVRRRGGRGDGRFRVELTGTTGPG